MPYIISDDTYEDMKRILERAKKVLERNEAVLAKLQSRGRNGRSGFGRCATDPPAYTRPSIATSSTAGFPDASARFSSGPISSGSLMARP